MHGISSSAMLNPLSSCIPASIAYIAGDPDAVSLNMAFIL